MQTHNLQSTDSRSEFETSSLPRPNPPELNCIHNVDCLVGMDQLPDKSIDLILCDLPYGTTANKWDSVIDLDNLWTRYSRLIRPRGAIVLTAQIPFSIALGASNKKWLKYEWIWRKTYSTGFLNAKKYPLKDHENILVFAPGLHKYNPQMSEGVPYSRHGTRPRSSSNYREMRAVPIVNEGTRYPKTVLTFPRDRNSFHPTQKPLALFEYLVRTYTDPGDVVLDNCSGSGTTAVACARAGRQFICFETDPDYYRRSLMRLEEARQQLTASHFDLAA